MPELPKVDSLSVDKFYREYHSWLFNWLIKKLNRPHHDADTTQDIFARVLALRKAFKLQPPKHFFKQFQK